ncbi:MAG: hypothetical protein OK452_03655 [Thaumarchaeota archaeon]|nr:hypothetical protein [Nitrososphaerota archaeon]
MILTSPERHRRKRKAVASILGTIIMLSLLFAGGVGFLIFANQNALATNQADAARQAAVQQASLENLALGVKSSSGQLGLTINNTGGATVTVLDVYVTKVTNGHLVSNSTVTPGSHYLSQKGDLNLTLPLSITMGGSTRTMTGCIAGQPGCDVAIKTSAYTYVSGTTILVSVLTSSGKVFSVQYPSSTAPSSQRNALVVKIVAAPPAIPRTCVSCASVTVFVYNYALSPVTGVTLNPVPPTSQVTGTARITNAAPPCAPAVPGSIPAYSGSGIAPSIKFTCTYNAQTGPVGGYATFSGAATGILNGVSISSAQEVSNTIQIGGTVSVLNQGPFTADSFYFKDTYCYQNGGIFYVSPCQQTPSGTLSLTGLPNANPQNGSADYYVAYYVNMTNNFNTTLSILQYSYFQTDPTLGGESNFYLVGSTSAYSTLGHYFPNYTLNTPTLVAYGGDAVTCAANPANCIQIAPGQSRVLTFAACRFGSTNWNWGDSQYGRAFDNPVACNPQAPPNYQTPESTYLSIVISFMYKNQVYDQQIPFQGETILGGNGGSASCNTGNFCGTVVYTQYTGSVGYFNFVYNPTASKFSIPTPPVVINNNLPHGADGVVYNPQDHKLLVGTNAPGDNAPWFNEVNPNTGVATTYNSNIYSLNVMVNSDGTRVYMDGDPGTGSLAWAPLTPTIGATTTLLLSGDDVNLNTVIFKDPTHVYYMAELGPRFQGTTGHVGTLDPTTGKTTCFKTAGVCTVFNGVHGGVYDPFTQDLIVFGYNVVNQIDPTTGALIATESVAALNPGSGNFDQGAVDGFGHLFVSWASGNGDLYFEDYSGGTIGTGNFHVITNGGNNNLGATAFNNIDDLAPIVGPGSQG